jgi:hypothetical protein
MKIAVFKDFNSPLNLTMLFPNSVNFFITVALNFQTPGLPMDLQNGKFLDNGGSGYILKPDILRDTTLGFNPNEPEYDDHPVTLTIRVRLMACFICWYLSKLDSVH